MSEINYTYKLTYKKNKNMKKNISNFLIIIIFIGMITFPQITWYLSEESKNVEKPRGRELNQMPKFEISTISQYSSKFEEYYSDFLPYGRKLRNLWSKINYNIFNTNTDEKVIVGKDGWLFFTGEEGQSIEQVQSMDFYSIKEKEDILSSLKANFHNFKNKGIDAYLFFVPNKENIYREYLPDTIPIKNDISPVEDLIYYIKDNSDIKVVYPKEELLKAKEKYQIYRKYDTHWNKIGSYFGTLALQKVIDPNFNYDVNNIEIEVIDKVDERDLAEINSSKDLYENRVIVSNFYPQMQHTYFDHIQYQEYVANEDNLDNSKNDKSILVIGDSFRWDMIDYFSKLYKKSYFMHREDYSIGLIEILKPDIIVLQVVERYYDRLNILY